MKKSQTQLATNPIKSKIKPHKLIDQFAVILTNPTLDLICNSRSHVLIENNASAGDLLAIKTGFRSWSGFSLGGDVLVCSNMIFKNVFFSGNTTYAKSLPITTDGAEAPIGEVGINAYWSSLLRMEDCGQISDSEMRPWCSFYPDAQSSISNLKCKAEL